MRYTNLCLLTRINSYDNKWSSKYLEPIFMASANFNLLFPETRKQKAVCICLLCNICVINMYKATDAFQVHTILKPTCPFVIERCQLVSPTAYDQLEIFKKHLYVN